MPSSLSGDAPAGMWPNGPGAGQQSFHGKGSGKGPNDDLLSSIGAMFDERVNRLVETLNGRVDQNETRTEHAHQRLDVVDNRLSKLENAMSQGGASEFVAEKIKVRSICKHSERRDLGITYDGAKIF
eukprot:9471867-Pyramimonas_sp.AAC.1